HYLHMIDSLETAYESGLWIRPHRGSDPKFAPKRLFSANRVGPFSRMVTRWMSLTYVLNDFNRGLGLQDAYPFVLTDAVLAKLEFVHDTVAARRRSGRSEERAP
ncbi:MAG: putative zinc-binding metallopeptidase, partial [Panacagrimonas sp.]